MGIKSSRVTSVFEYKGCLRWCQQLHVLPYTTKPWALSPGSASIEAGAQEILAQLWAAGREEGHSQLKDEVFSPSQSPGWTGSPSASLLAAGGHSVDMDHWRGVYVGGAEPVTLASGQQGNCLCQGFAETQTWWKRDEGSCPKGRSGLFFVLQLCFWQHQF